ncbi:hypothetical protein [Streptomonospora wellingtoniae]|uniref:Uncharacterized protein n=1 Tax=Streptomonospora wellingtoniae TaxID=3075544 RepID=A0ABU2KTX4_9ACTN|nr:hypothetical protein [Streptomonospora sp. DSM 45055]MDT0302750.1 hypothetical protein [Streptomonospora sp. DSM 45055]
MTSGESPSDSPEEIKGNILEFLRRGIEGKGGRIGGETALEWIPKLYVALGNRFPDTPETRQFKDEVVEQITSGENPHRIAIYIAECYNYATDWEPNSYSIARFMRSAVQLFSDEFMDIEEVIPEPDRGEIEEIDEILDSPRPNVEPLGDVRIPGWVPDSHWWWTKGR